MRVGDLFSHRLAPAPRPHLPAPLVMPQTVLCPQGNTSTLRAYSWLAGWPLPEVPCPQPNTWS